MTVQVSPTPEALLYLGAAQAGKTQRLIERACALARGEGGNAGAAPDAAAVSEAGDLLVLCATPQACDEFARRLAERGVRGVRVATPRQVALQLLDDPAAHAFTGRRARMLLPFEEDFLFEDLRTLGLKQRRAVEMLRFMKRNFSEAADDADWLISSEEEAFLGLLRSCLQAAGAMMECEVAAFALRWLKAEAQAAAHARVSHVLVDDYHLMSRASQLLANELAESSICVAADPSVSIETFDSFPFARGIDEFQEANPCVRVELLGAPVDATETPALFEHLANLPIAVDELAFEHSEDEVRGVASLVQGLLAEGMSPHDVCIVYASRQWGRELERMLPRLGVPVAVPQRGSALRGDVRDARASAVAKAFSLLALAADESDVLAWRSACGFGDSLAQSYGFSLLRAHAEEHGMPLDAVVRSLCTSSPEEQPAVAAADALPEPLPDSARLACKGIARAAEHAERLLQACANLRGEELLFAVARAAADASRATEVSQKLAQLAAPVLPGDDASALVARMCGRLHVGAPTAEPAGQPGHGPSRSAWTVRGGDSPAQAVRVLAPQDCVGVCARVVVMSGMVNGFSPPRRFFDASALVEDERRKLWQSGAQRIYLAAGKAREKLVATRFTRIAPEGAERYELEVERVRFERGKRTCVAAESAYLPHLRR